MPLKPHKTLLASALIALTGQISAQSLESVLRQSLPVHPIVQKAVATARSTGYEVEVAQAGYRPRISTFAESGKGLAGDVPRNNSANYGVKGQYYFYDAGRVDADVGRAKAKQQGSKLATELAELEVSARIAELYFEALKQRALAEVAQQNLKDHDEIYEKVAEIVKLDGGRRFDLEQVQARRRNAALAYFNRIKVADDSLLQLGMYAGIAMNTGAMMPPRLVQKSDWPNSLDFALERLITHPRMRQSFADLEQARAQSKLALAGTRPRVGVELNLTSPKPTGQDRQWFQGLDGKFIFNWDAYDGGAALSAASQATELESAAFLGVQATRREVGNALGQVWNEWQQRQARIPALQGIVEQNKTISEGYFELFKVGRRTIVDLLNALNDKFTATTNLASEQYDEHLSNYRVKFAMGEQIHNTPIWQSGVTDLNFGPDMTKKVDQDDRSNWQKISDFLKR